MIRFGLSEEAQRILYGIFSGYGEVRKVIVYGSRVKGTYSERSDLDLVISDSIISRQLIEHIKHLGQVIYTKEEIMPSDVNSQALSV